MSTSPLLGQRSDALILAPHPEAVAEENLAAWAEQQIEAGRPIAIDLFSGAGGLSAGIEAAGWSVAAAVDHNVRALETHRHNFPGLALNLDLGDAQVRDDFVRRFDGIKVDLVAGGPPCQPFSRAGRSKIRSLVEAGVRDAVDLRKELWQAFLDIAVRLEPRAILMENVPDMGLGDDFRVIRIMVDELEERGYTTHVRIAEAWKYGVPQHRKRLILLARNDGHDFTWPSDARDITDLKDAIGDLPGLDGGTGARALKYMEGDSPSAFATRMREGAEPTVIHDHMTRGVRADDLEIFQLMNSKTLYSQIPQHLRRYAADSFTDKYKRLDWKELSRSITAHIAKDGYWYIHPEEHRTLTVREAARIQTFPDRFRFAGTRSDAFRQIGNAVPPFLGEAAATAVAPRTDSAVGTTPQWLEARKALADWAHAERQTGRWFMFPGPDVTPPVALAAAVLSGGKHDLTETAAALRHLRGLAHLNKRPFDAALRAVSRKAKLALGRLVDISGRRSIWNEPASVTDLVRLNETERGVYHMLRGEDVLLRSQSVLRLAARVAGTKSHETNRLTEGRIDLARLVGSGPDAPIRMAAIRVLAATHCCVDHLGCPECPLAPWCATRQSEPGPVSP